MFLGAYMKRHKKIIEGIDNILNNYEQLSERAIENYSTYFTKSKFINNLSTILGN